MKIGTRDNWIWAITIAIWLVGFWLIRVLWYAHPFGTGGADALYGFVLVAIATFYVLALIPIRRTVSRAWPDRNEPEPAIAKAPPISVQDLKMERVRKNLAAVDKLLAGKLSPADRAVAMKGRAMLAANLQYRQKLAALESKNNAHQGGRPVAPSPAALTCGGIKRLEE